jgi:hypothetical protein
MFFEPIEIELDKPRKVFLKAEALMRAEKEINRQRDAKIADHVSIDFLIFKAASDFLQGTGNFPLDLVAVLLWAGLNAAPHETKDEVTVDKVLDLIDLSPLPRGQILTRLWEHYSDVTKREPSTSSAQGNGEDKPDPLARRPGSTSGVLQ